MNSVSLPTIGFSAPLPAQPIPVMCQLLDVMDQAVELPLRIDLLPASQGETVDPFVMPEIPEHRLNGGEALPVQSSSFFAANRPFHEIGVTHLR